MTDHGRLSYLHPDAESCGDQYEVCGPVHAWLAVLVAAAGRHHLQLTGSSGSSVPAFAKLVRHLQPNLPLAHARHVYQIRRHAYLPRPQGRLDRRPPWQSPHHTISLAALVGDMARPGAISLAHHGVLGLNLANEFARAHLNAIAAAVRDREIVLARAGDQVTRPADVQLVLGCHPCPCGGGETPCKCSSQQRQRHVAWLTPLTSLTDLRINLDRRLSCPDYGLTGGSLQPLRDRVIEARRRAARRFNDPSRRFNSRADDTLMLHPAWEIPDATELLQPLVERGALSVRRTTAIRRVAWTLADLAGLHQPDVGDVTTALLLHDIT